MKPYTNLILALILTILSFGTKAQSLSPGKISKGSIQKEVKKIELSQLGYNTIKLNDVIKKIDSTKIFFELEAWYEPATGELKKLRARFEDQEGYSSQEVYYFKNNYLIYAKNIEYASGEERYKAEIWAINYINFLIYINNEKTKPTKDVVEATRLSMARDIKLYIAYIMKQ